MEDFSSIPVLTGLESIQLLPKGRTIEYEYNGEHRKNFVEFTNRERKWKPLRRSITDDHVLTDDEIEEIYVKLTKEKRTVREQSKEYGFLMNNHRIRDDDLKYGLNNENVQVVKFFDDRGGERNENVLQDIKSMNSRDNMGNVSLPDSSIEIVNFSPCPNCGHVYSFKDLFLYFQKPKRDIRFKTIQEQYLFDTKVSCVECGTEFLPSLVVINESPRSEYRMICRSQTLREICLFMKRKFRSKVLWLREENILSRFDDGIEYRAWKNDLNVAHLKAEPTLFSSFIQNTPYYLVQDFLDQKNLHEAQPVFGSWLPSDQITRAYKSSELQI